MRFSIRCKDRADFGELTAQYQQWADSQCRAWSADLAWTEPPLDNEGPARFTYQIFVRQVSSPELNFPIASWIGINEAVVA